MATPGGYLYAIGAEGSPYVKIGCTHTTVESRLKSLQIGHPSRLTLLASLAVDGNLYKVERQVHQLLAGERRTGEWFETTMDQQRFAALVADALHAIQIPLPLVLPATTRPPVKHTAVFSTRIAAYRHDYDVTNQALLDLNAVYFMTIAQMSRASLEALTERLVLALRENLATRVTLLLDLLDFTRQKEEREREVATADGALQGASAVADAALVQGATLREV